MRRLDCLVSGTRRHDHIMPVLAKLHCSLPVRSSVSYFKSVGVGVVEVSAQSSPRYLADFCVQATFAGVCNRRLAGYSRR